MKKNIFQVIIPVLTLLLTAALIYIFTASNQRLTSELLKTEKNIRDSLSKKIVILAEQSDSLSAQIRTMTETLKADRLKLTIELNKIRNEKPPIINYSYYTDSALIRRLSGR